MELFKLAGRLNRSLPSSYVVAARPDHPKLISGPDIVIGGMGNTVAIFIAHHNEKGNSAPLMARLTACRLAFPIHTKCVLVSPSNKAFSQYILTNFHEVFVMEKLRGLNKFIQDKYAGNNLDKIPEKIQKLVNTRFNTLFQIALLREKRNRKGKGAIGIVKDLGRDPRLAPDVLNKENVLNNSNRKISVKGIPKVVAYEGNIIAPKRFNNHSSDIQSLRSIYDYSILDSFEMDRGVPYPTNLKTNILVTNRLPTARFDPLKPVRAAAFAGWTVTKAESEEDVLRLSDRINEIFNERRNEP